MSSNPSPKNNRKSQRLHSLILASFLISAAMASGCRWDDSLYKKYPGPVTCTGYCVGVENLDKDGCLSLNGTWHPDDCINEVLPEVEGEVVKPAANEEECIAHSGNWKPGYCEISKTVCQEKVKLENSEIEYNKGYCMGAKELTQEECEKELTDGKPIGKWDNDHCVIDDLRCQDIHSSLENIQWLELEWHDLDYRILDIGEGEYIRCMEVKKEGDKRISCEENSLVCGTMAQITSENPPPCDITKTKYKQAVADMEESLPGSICQKDAGICVEVKALSEETEIGIGMCSSCPQDNVVCGNECVNPLFDIYNCGECGKKCDEEKDLCVLGECIPKNICEYPAFLCEIGQIDEEGNPLLDENNKQIIEQKCINPEGRSTCGVSKCEDLDKIINKNNPFLCGDGFKCESRNNNYECICPSGITKDGKCLDPSSNTSCGAGQNGINDYGTNCPAGTSCISYKDEDLNQKFHCSCTASWQLSCYHDADAGVDCINPSNDDMFCSAVDCEDTTHQCPGDRHCANGLCVCKDKYVTCNDKCIDPLTDESYCGAKGNCLDDPNNENNSAGEICSENEVCENGKCVCNKNSVDCNGECLKLGTDSVCNIDITDNVCKILDCTVYDKVCRLVGGDYACECPSGTVLCGGECIDPKTNSYYCGASGRCINEYAGTDDFKGENCTLNTNGKTVCVNGECASGCPREQANCNGICVTRSEYNINEFCNDCDLDHCYTGERNADGIVINFDYKKCLSVNENGEELNRLYSDNYCGKTCETAVVCSEGLSCNSVAECSCNSFDNILCTQFETDDNEAEQKCVNKIDTHQTDCGVCEDGWLDCDGDRWNGCEVDSRHRVDHCGECNNNCNDKLENAVGIACVEGECAYSYCKENYGDCDGVGGCEKLGIMNDPDNCGSCGKVCNYRGCNNSVCCAVNGMESVNSSDLNCCMGLKKFKYEHNGWWIFSTCSKDDHYGCYLNNPDDDCWSEYSD